MRKNFCKVVCIALVAIVCLSLVACGTQNSGGKTKKKSVKFSLDSWMENIDGTKLLSEINIPGTHDTGAVRNDTIYAMGRTQELSIAEQLTDGVRAMDIRLGVDGEELMIYHGVLDEEISFDSVVADCKAFLTEHPTETVILTIKKEAGKKDIAPYLKAYYDAEPELWYLQSTLPTLDEVRGKIVLFRRYSSDENVGVDLGNGWQDDCSFTIEGEVTCHVQDHYCIPSAEQMVEKWEDMNDLFALAKESDKEDLILNFGSSYVAIKISEDTSLPDVRTAADFINEKMKTEFAKMESGRYGIIYYDYVTADLSSIVIKKNF